MLCREQARLQRGLEVLKNTKTSIAGRWREYGAVASVPNGRPRAKVRRRRAGLVTGFSVAVTVPEKEAKDQVNRRQLYQFDRDPEGERQ